MVAGQCGACEWKRPVCRRASAFQKSAVLDSAELFDPQTMQFEPVLNTLSALDIVTEYQL